MFFFSEPRQLIENKRYFMYMVLPETQLENKTLISTATHTATDWVLEVRASDCIRLVTAAGVVGEAAAAAVSAAGARL